MTDATHHRFCLIIGAGPSGLIQAFELVRKGFLQHDEFEILERQDGYGGVWQQATYPGAACDVESHVYQVSWYLNPSKFVVHAPSDKFYRLDPPLCLSTRDCGLLRTFRG
jgi:cation diffusion facilitator CzcD-associated flavoprotein CzcO